MPEEIFEEYSDVFDVVGNAYGLVINFNVSPPVLSQFGGTPTTKARIRLSWEMAKVLTCVMMRYIKKTEYDRQVSYPIPMEILNSLQIPRDDWDSLWSSPKFDLGGEK